MFLYCTIIHLLFLYLKLTRTVWNIFRWQSKSPRLTLAERLDLRIFKFFAVMMIINHRCISSVRIISIEWLCDVSTYDTRQNKFSNCR